MLASPLLCDPADKAQLEADNVAAQLDNVTYLVVDRAITDVEPWHIRDLHALAIRGIYPCAGKYRSAAMKVLVSGWEPPAAADVPRLVDGMVEDLRQMREAGVPAIPRAAYVLWRLNRIHPYAGGNGRTARALCYLIVCAAEGFMIGGTPTIPERIAQRRDDYINALQTADAGDHASMIQLVEDVVTGALASM